MGCLARKFLSLIDMENLQRLSLCERVHIKLMDVEKSDSLLKNREEQIVYSHMKI